MLTASLIPAAFAASIVTCFTPEQDGAALAIGAIDAAGHEILVNAYAFTTGSGIPTALVRAHARGVDVRLVADRHAPCDLQEGVSAVAAAGSRYGSMSAPGSRTETL
jgi:phosphatidylserine/phosphatidylglycerophosphate/cardiolipin synthase-like enzyme